MLACRHAASLCKPYVFGHCASKQTSDPLMTEAPCFLEAGMLFATVVEDNCNAPTGATPQVQ